METRLYAHPLFVAGLLVIAGLSGCSPKPDAPKPVAHNVTLTDAQRAHIQIFTVSAQPFHKSIEVTGVVDFDNDQATIVLAPFSGPISRVLVSPGDRVAKGQALATVGSPDFAAAVATYSKALLTARTNRKLAEADKDLLAHKGISQREAEQAETDAVNAEADRDAALQALASLGVDPQSLAGLQQGKSIAHVDGVIRAPLAGTVAEKLVTPGQLLQAGSTPTFTIADLSKVWVMAQVSDSDLASVHPGDTVDVIAGSSEQGFKGTVDNIAAEVDPVTRSILARIVVPNPGAMLKKQMYVRVRINAHQQNTGILVPVSAILRDDENLPFVYAVQADGSYARQHVTLGDRSGDQYEISDGAKAGDRIVVDGGLFLQFMESQ